MSDWSQETIKTATICLTIFCTISSIAWAVAIGNIFTPASKNSLEQQCLSESLRETPICMAIAERIKGQGHDLSPIP